MLLDNIPDSLTPEAKTFIQEFVSLKAQARNKASEIIGVIGVGIILPEEYQ